MAIKPDHLDNPVVVEAKITPTGLSVSAKSRFVAAIDRLCGNIFDAFNIPIEKHNKKARVSMEAEVADLKATLKDFLKNHKEQYPQIERAVTNENNAIARKQANKDEVVRIAKETLDQQNDEVSEGSTTQSLDPDWLNDFESFAEKASSEEMQMLFGKILAGEVLSPGAYSRTTIRTVWELDRRNAEVFQKFALHRLRNFIPFVRGNDSFEELLDLETTGLISFSSGNLSTEFKDNNNGICDIVGSSYLFKIHLSEHRTGLAIPAIALSKQGQEVACLVTPDELGGIHKVAKVIEDQYSKIEIFRITGKTPSQISFNLIPIDIIQNPKFNG